MKKVETLGISFFNGNVFEIIDLLRKSGGLLVVPSGPGLATIDKERDYYQSLLESDFAIADSGYMALIWNIFHRNKINRISGLEFLKVFLEDQDVKEMDSLFLINPSAKEAESNKQYLKARGFSVKDENSYQAPMYGDHIADTTLLSRLEMVKPKFVIVNIGGGVQERLGAYLRRHLTFKPAIICTGAAIAFLTGNQATIPNWVDKLYLGWLFRCIQDPIRYIPRYLKAFKLIFLLVKYGEKSPKL
jgi:N-acetylglucosaminyldiphosphoundecaprenol N-acetyl-beta-D-mannosaminyltransferase